MIGNLARALVAAAVIGGSIDVAGAAAFFGWQVAELNSQSFSPALDLNLRWLYLSAVTGGVLIAIYSLASIRDGWRGRWPGLQAPEEI